MSKEYKKKILKGSLWVTASFVLSQLLRLGSNMIATRLLGPEIFGVMAIGTVLMQGTIMFSDVGLWPIIIRSKRGTKEVFLNTVWTMQVIRGWGMFLFISLAVLIFLVTKDLFGFEVKGVYGNPVLPYIILAIGASAVLNAHTSMASAIISKELKRGKIEIISFVSQLVSLVVMLSLAYAYGSIWALVSAGIVSTMVTLILNYTMFPYRHSLAWDKSVIKEVMSFGKWIIFSSALTFLCLQGDALLFGYYLTEAQVGVYSVAFLLANAAITLVKRLTKRIWFPVFSTIIQNNRKKLFQSYYKTRLIQDSGVFFISGFLMATGSVVVGILYNDDFYEAGWMLEILAVSIGGYSVSVLGEQCLTALGITKVRMTVTFIRAVGLFVGLPVLFHFFGMQGAVWAVAINVWLGTPLLFFELYKQGLFSFKRELIPFPMAGVGFFVGQGLVSLL